MKNPILAALMLISMAALAQNEATSLYGFQLEQYRETTVNELGKPYEQDQHEDGTQYDIFAVKPNGALYVVFEYLPTNPEAIFTIQVTGSYTGADMRFKGLKLGDTAARVEEILGAPTDKSPIGEYGERWDYSTANYTLEINPEGKLGSIKIKNMFPENKPDTAKLPDFKADILPKLTSKKNADIALLLAPDVEVAANNKLFYFTQSFDTEIKQDKGKVYEAIKLASKGLNKINTSNTDSYKENMRLAEGMPPLHVITINDKNTTIKEIVFKFQNGKWLIWEFKIE